MTGKLTFPIRPSSDPPTRRRPSFRVRVRAAADLPKQMVGETRFDAYRTPLLQFIADWNRTSDKARLVEKAPVYEGADPRLLPSIAAVVHALVDRCGMPVPDWVWEHRLSKDWVLFSDPGERGSVLWERDMRSAPSTCAHHRVYFHHRLLDKGTPDWWLAWT